MNNIQIIYEYFIKSDGVNIDTRTLKENQIFFALKGVNYDANDFIEQALSTHPALVVSDREHDSPKVITVQDTLVALQLLAKHHRTTLETQIIGITGSNGKTTTKNLIFSVLSRKFSCLATEGNYNNHIGVPLTLLALDRTHEFAVVEMGANHSGEIEELCKIVMPDFGVITNIGKAHLEGFGSIDEVRKTKRALYDSVASKGGVIFLDSSDSVLMGIAPIGTTQVNYPSYVIKASFPYLVLEINGHIIESQLFGDYNSSNIACAFAIGMYFEMDIKDVSLAIAKYAPENKRSQVIAFETNKVILDCYNANPESMKNAITNFARINHAKKVLILGDMLELGSYSKEEHQWIINLIAEHKWLHVYLIGAEFSKSLTTYSKFSSIHDLKDQVPISSLNNCLILIKGSRGVYLEKYLDM